MSFDLDKYRLEQADFSRNTSTRVPICLMVDTSLSMKLENRMSKINDGVKKFIADMKNDPYAVSSVELCIVTFGGIAEVYVPFTEIGKLEFKDMMYNGKTPLGEATEIAVNAVMERLKLYDEKGITNFNPWIIIFSDGLANDDTYKKYAKHLCQLQTENRWKVMTIGLGSEKNSLADFTPNHNVYGLKDIDVSDFFDWISQSVSNLSKSRPDITNYSDEELRFKGNLL